MAHMKIIGAVMAASLIFGSGVAIAQMNDLVARTAGPDEELRAAQQSLVDAIAHLKNVRDPRSRRNLRALDLVQSAQKELRYEDGAGP